MTYLLLCEGKSCNPYIEIVDQMRRRDNDRLFISGAAMVSDDTKALMRRLVYTDHVLTASMMAECTVCGTRRRYGH